LGPLARLILLRICSPRDQPFTMTELKRELDRPLGAVRTAIKPLQKAGYLEKREVCLIKKRSERRDKRPYRVVFPTNKAFAAVFVLKLLPLDQIEKWLRDLSQTRYWQDIREEFEVFADDVVEKEGLRFFRSRCAFPTRAFREPFLKLVKEAENKIDFLSTSSSLFPWGAAIPFADAIKKRGLKSTILLLDPSNRAGRRPDIGIAGKREIEENIRRYRELGLSNSFQIKLYNAEIDYSMVLVDADPKKKEGFIEVELHLDLPALSRPAFRITAGDAAFSDYYSRFMELKSAAIMT
jgi:hypothetical protein